MERLRDMKDQLNKMKNQVNICYWAVYHHIKQILLQTTFYKQMYIDNFDRPWNGGDLASLQFTFFIFLRPLISS